MLEDKFMDQYAGLADAVISDSRPNTQSGIPLSNAEMVQEICGLMSWDSFDLLDSYDFKSVYEKGDESQLTAHIYIAHLRHELFHSAMAGNIGDIHLNRYVTVFHEYWCRRLYDKLEALASGGEPSHRWIH